VFVSLLSIVTESHRGGKQASLVLHVSNWMPSSETGTLSDLSVLYSLMRETEKTFRNVKFRITSCSEAECAMPTESRTLCLLSKDFGRNSGL